MKSSGLHATIGVGEGGFDRSVAVGEKQKDILVTECSPVWKEIEVIYEPTTGRKTYTFKLVKYMIYSAVLYNVRISLLWLT